MLTNTVPDNKGKKFKVITLCGSTRFKNEFLQAQKELTLKGYIVTGQKITTNN